VNRFWDSIDYCTAHNFLGNFSDAEQGQLPVESDSADDTDTKLRLLLRLLREKIDRQEGAASPPGSLYETGYEKWYSLWQGVFRIQDMLGLPEAEDTVRMLVAKAKGRNIVPGHMLAEYLAKNGKYREAEETERPVLAWMEGSPGLGRDSPQAINARRIMVKALWGQGQERRGEAESMLAELEEIVDRMGGGKFGVYQEEERSLNRQMMAQLDILT